MYSQDPERRFCGQCGERRTTKDSGGERCADCAATPVPTRFCMRTGRRLDPPPAERRPLLSSGLSAYDGSRGMPARGAAGVVPTNPNEGGLSR